MSAILGAAIGTAIAGLLGSGLGLGGSIYQAQKNSDTVSDTNALNKDLALHQMQYKVADYQAAGLNKVLASQGSSASYSPTMQAATQNVDYDRAGASVGQALQLGLQYAQTQADLARAQAEVKNREAQTSAIGLTNATELLKQQQIQAQTAKTQADLAGKQIENQYSSDLFAQDLLHRTNENKYYGQNMETNFALRSAQTLYQQQALQNLIQTGIGLRIANQVAGADAHNYQLNWYMKNLSGGGPLSLVLKSAQMFPYSLWKNFYTPNSSAWEK